MIKREIIIRVDNVDYSKEDIQNMDNNQLKMLISFIDNEKEINIIYKWTNSNVIKVYINNLIDNIKRNGARF